MVKLNYFSLAVTFAGCFLGAGYLSGNELMQFFGNFGVRGLWGCVLSVLLISLFGFFVLYISREKATKRIEDVILSSNNRVASVIICTAQAILVFSIVVIMTAGAGQLIEDTVGLNSKIAGIIFCIVVAVIAYAGVSGMVALFSLLVPIIALMTLGISAYYLITSGFPVIKYNPVSQNNPLLTNWFVASIAYLSFSIFSSVGVLAPLGNRIYRNRTSVIGTMVGGIVLIVIAVAVLISIFSCPESFSCELPMLIAAASVSNMVGYIYAVLLLLGMFGAALTSLIALINFINTKTITTSKNLKKILPILLVALAYFCSLFGFSDLIGIIYPVYGYLGLIVLVIIAFNFVKLHIRSNRNPKRK